MSIILCRPKPLPLDKLAAAERRAIEINPENAAHRRTVMRMAPGGGGRRGAGERRIAVVVARRWPSTGVRLSVSFMDNPPAGLRTRILSHMNAWGEQANVIFSETAGVGQVRIARLDSPAEVSGYWSYIGTEILDIANDEATLNLDGFTMRTPDSEFRRVVRHEAGHTLGFEHEHMRSEIVKRIDRAKAIAFYRRDQGWTPEEVAEQVLTPLAERSIMGTAETDPVSIMCYDLPAKIMKDRKPVRGGTDINPRDAAFAASLYPKPGRSPVAADAVTDTTPLPAALAAAERDDDDADTFQLIVMDEFSPGRAEDGAEHKPEFAQVLASYAGARVTATLRLHKGADKVPTLFGGIIAMHERIRAYTNRERGTLPTDEELVRFGGLLFETLLQGDVRRLYDEARTRQQGRRLDFVLTSMIPWIGEKPWEFAFDTGRKTFLATEEIHFVRNVLTNVPADPVARRAGPLRILVASAQPVGFGRLSVDQEVKVIRRGFENLIEDGLVTVDVIARTTPEQLHRSILRGSYQVVHFIGHGIFENNEGMLVFESGRGGEVRLGERSLREIFCKRGLSLVFLNACESGRGGRAEFNKGAAQSLVAHGLPALVANQYSVLDASATSFAQHFYWSLAQGLSVGQAAREARIAVNYTMNGEPIDWAVPVLYARDPGMRLCDAPPPPSATTGRRAPARRAVAGREVVVAMWDLDNVFPAIDRTIDTLNAVQAVFGFELARISAPLDIWDLNPQGEGQTYLWAERVAARLKTTAAELNADVVFCVTRHWLRNDDWMNLYGWWPELGGDPVLIFSVAGFEALPPEGPEADRALANTLTTCLAGYYANAESHERGAKDCPLAFGRKRDYQTLTGPQRFDAGCLRRIGGALGNKLPALNAILSAFQPADADR